MGIIAGIAGFFKALPDIMTLVKELQVWITHVSGGDPAGYVVKVGNAMATLNGAKTEQERQDAAKAIATAIKNLG